MNFKFRRNRKRPNFKNGWSRKNHKRNLIFYSEPKINMRDDYVFVENILIKRKKKVFKLSKFFSSVLKHYPKLRQYWENSRVLSEMAGEDLMTESFQKEFSLVLKIEGKENIFKTFKKNAIR